ncbi:MAG TPA: LysR family transcriptional regulator [Rhizobiaceae bacterium]|nr:LysR family transcriptional regulator [Rhizobiaceae bacterium]
MDRNLRAFKAVVTTGNLTAAAALVGLTQPALTKTIRRLEREFGARLFERTPRGMVLTEAGHRLNVRVQAIDMHYRQATEEVHAISSGSVRRFSIAAGAVYHMTMAPDLVKLLSSEFPETDFTLDFDVAGLTLPKLVEGEIDLMLGALHGVPPEGVSTREFLDVEITPYCCRGSSLANRRKIAPADLAGCKWIIYKRDRLLAERLRIYCSDHRLPPPVIRMEIDVLAASFRIVSGTEFLTLAPTSLEGVAAAAGLVPLNLQRPIWKFISGAWFRKSSSEYPIMRRALQALPALAATAAQQGHNLQLY